MIRKGSFQFPQGLICNKLEIHIQKKVQPIKQAKVKEQIHSDSHICINMSEEQEQGCSQS